MSRLPNGIVARRQAIKQKRKIVGTPSASIELLEPRQLMSAATSSQITEYQLPDNVVAVGAMVKGPDGNLWFTYQGGHYIPVTNPAPGLATQVFQGGWGVGDISPGGKYQLLPVTDNAGLSSLIVGPDNNLWTIQTQDVAGFPSVLERISTNGDVATFPDPFSGGTLVAGSDGDIWTAAIGGSAIDRFNPKTDQIVSNFPLPAPILAF